MSNVLGRIVLGTKCRVLFLAGLSLLSQSLSQTSVAQENAVRSSREFYLGRRIAPAMTHRAADWLIRAERDAEEDPSQMLGQLGLKPGMVVCDMGCGNGFYSLTLAEMVGPTGKVLAVDIQPQMLQLLSRRAAEKKSRISI